MRLYPGSACQTLLISLQLIKCFAYTTDTSFYAFLSWFDIVYRLYNYCEVGMTLCLWSSKRMRTFQQATQAKYLIKSITRRIRLAGYWNEPVLGPGFVSTTPGAQKWEHCWEATLKTFSQNSRARSSGAFNNATMPSSPVCASWIKLYLLPFNKVTALSFSLRVFLSRPF